MQKCLICNHEIPAMRYKFHMDRCGLNFKNKSNIKINLPNDEVIWKHRAIAVNMLLVAVKDGVEYILIAQRGKGMDDFPGFWNIISGYVDWNETIKDAVFREMYEETGINLNLIFIKYKILKEDINFPWEINSEPDANKQNISLRHGLIFECDELPLDFTTEYSEKDEISEIKWISLNEISLYNFAFKHHEVIKMYLKK